MKRILIVGASSGIAQALIKQHMSTTDYIFAVSRKAPVSQWPTNVIWQGSDYQELTIKTYCDNIIEQYGPLDRVYICNGVLHHNNFFPEKSLEQTSVEYFNQTMMVNLHIPSMWLKYVCLALPKDAQCTLTTFSARIGSITDNRLGGWYAYRTSKAALNMFIKNLSIEMARRTKNVKLIAFHPGTTDTPLSKPFQKNLAPQQLLSPSFVAEKLDNIIQKIDYQGKALFLDWRGKEIPW